MYQSAMATLLSALALTSFLLITTAHAGRRSSQKNSGEIFRLGVVSHATSTYTGKTNSTDVLGLVYLFTQYPLLEEANEDPCFPPVWSWIECNSDPRPRVIALNLASRLLFGTLPDFSFMDALESIDLQQNSLYGIIPSFLGDFPNLQNLNLANNLFTGQVPDSIACNKNLQLSLDGNYGLYASNSCPSGINKAVPKTTTTSQPNYSGDGYVYTPTTYGKKSKTPVIVGIVVSLSGVIGIAVGIFAIFRHKAKVAAAVAAANAQGANHEQSNPKLNIPMEEMPMNTRPTNLSP
ncbi:uncharacterized protein LOC142556754 [Primulina tabacum]|uniref:uncharacterized protein LOC142556754 n=1 Tax=Primulina tabacum TaxID=48773 RepID=UPI003F5A58A0